jgi:hypothetical protein
MAETPLCPACHSELPANAKFCPLTADGAVARAGAPEKESRSCVICGRAVSPSDSFRCPLCAREHLCSTHMVNGRTWAAGQRKVTIPTCCEVCYGEEYGRNHALIEALKKERSCGVCGLLDTEFRCSACGKHFCARHALERMLKASGQTPNRTYAILFCSRCGNICADCAGVARPGPKKCKKCGGRVSEDPGDKLHAVLARCVSKGYSTGYAPHGYDEKGLPR